MKLGNLNFFLLFLYIFLININISLSEEKIESVPLVNLEQLEPTFEEGKDEFENEELDNTIKTNDQNKTEQTEDLDNNKIYINIKALDKITAKTSAIRLALGEKKFFGPLEIKALKCQLSEGTDSTDTVAYLQVKDLSVKDNNQVFLFNGWTFASSPTLQSIDHPVYDLWITSCDNI